ncbi:MAG: hypothetical protein NTX07_09540 [Solirubrobacterales bacterium]|nr:hypothetical protein [Solirubrobacterales bacterium]
MHRMIHLLRRNGSVGAATLLAVVVILGMAVAPVALLWLSPALALVLMLAVGLSEPATEFLDRARRFFSGKRSRRPVKLPMPGLPVFVALSRRVFTLNLAVRPPPAAAPLHH